ncbi:hypothetical protein [Peribacillus acanthi]|nr:hypothetical protein [Peribacillus acanthi]
MIKNYHRLSKLYLFHYLQDVDMFPHSTHVECCVLLEKK